jgi:hypothetical protein
MIQRRKLLGALTGWLSLLAFGQATKTEIFAQSAEAEEPVTKPGTEMLTIFLRHDQSKTVEEINQHLKANGWYSSFPPKGVEIVSWYVMMGIGQVVTLQFPAERLREVNRLIESKAWGSYRTEFYPTYDFRSIYVGLQDANK